MSGLRGFRYQTGEVSLMVDDLKQGKIVSADIDVDSELDIYFSKLSEFGFIRSEDIAPDLNAIDTVENPEFIGRYAFKNQANELVYVDFYQIEKEEETYADVGLG